MFKKIKEMRIKREEKRRREEYENSMARVKENLARLQEMNVSLKDPAISRFIDSMETHVSKMAFVSA